MQRIKLKNGIRTCFIPFKNTETVTVLVMVKVGSRYERPEISGASHFIEHLMFKGTKKRPTTLDISRDLDSVGAEFNAYTGKDRTGYYVKVAGEHLPLAIDVLHDMLFHSRFDPREVKRERGVIIEEINMYHDNPLMFVEDLFEQTLFAGNTLGWEIAGSRQSMTTMTRAEVINFRDSYYVPSEMVVVLAGCFNEGSAKQLLEKTFGQQMPVAATALPRYTPFIVGSGQTAPRIKVKYQKTKQVQIVWGFPSYCKIDRRTPAVKLLATILGGTMSSRLFIAVRERRGLAYLIRASQSEYEDVGVFAIQAGLDLTRLALATRVIGQEIRRIKKTGVTTEELRRAKDNLRGRVALALEDSMHQAEFYADQELFCDRVKTPEERLAEFDKVTRKQVQQAANQILRDDRLSLASIGPYRSPGDLQKYFSATSLNF